MLLATSMVLSSVSVTSFASDEVIFGEDVVATTDASEEVGFADGVEEDAADGEDAGDDVSFSDEIIEDDTVVEDEYVEDVADAGADLAFEEEIADPVVQEDVASAEENLSDYINEMSLDAQVADAEADYAYEGAVTTEVTDGSITYGDDIANVPVFYTLSGGDVYYDENGTIVADDSAVDPVVNVTFAQYKTKAGIAEFIVVDLTPTIAGQDFTASDIKSIGRARFSGYTQYQDAGDADVQVDDTFKITGMTFTNTAGNANVEVTARPVTVVWDKNTKINFVKGTTNYTYPLPTLQNVVNNDFAPKDLAYTYDPDDGSVTLAEPNFAITTTKGGVYKITAALPAGTTNYTLVNTAASEEYPNFVDVYVVGDMSTEFSYDGEEHSIDTSSMEGIALKYSTVADPEVGTITDSPYLPMFKEVGEHKVTVKYYDKDKQADQTIDAYCVIKKIKAVAKLKDATFTYGDTATVATLGADTKLKLTTDSFTYEDENGNALDSKLMELADGKAWKDIAAAKVKFTATGATSATEVTWAEALALHAGSYKFTITDEDLNKLFKPDNVTFIAAKEQGTLTVEPKEIKVKWSTKDKLDYADGNDVVYIGEGSIAAPAPASTTDAAATAAAATFTYSGLTAQNVGEYEAKITAVTNKDNETDYHDFKVAESDATHKWSIVGKAITLEIDLTSINGQIAYGAEDPTKGLTIDNITAVAFSDATEEIDKTKIGTPKFEVVNYEQYAPVGTQFDVTATLTGGAYEVKQVKTKKATVRKANVDIIPDDVVVPYGTEEMPKLTYTLADSVKDSGEAAAVEHDLLAKKLEITLATTPEEPKARGTYPINATVKFTSNAENFNFTKKQGNYIISKGDFGLKVEDYEGTYDEKSHGLVITPDLKNFPNGVTMYFSETDYKAGQTDAAAKAAFVSENRTTQITKKEVGTYPIYYYVTSEDYGIDLLGSKKITILGEDEGKAAEVKKQIAEAATPDEEGNLDPEKVKAAREAYEALSDYQKPLVGGDAVKQLEEAEKKVAEQADKKAAKDVEDKIAALPEADKVTEADKADIEAARKAYDDLTDAQKALIPAETLKKLTDDEEALKKAEEGDAEKAAEVVADIDKLPEADKATAADKEAADAAKAKYDALSDEAKKLVPEEKVKKLNDVKKAADEAAEKEAAAKKEVEDFDKVVAAVRETKNGVDGKEAAEKAKEKYDALSPEAKALLTEEEKTAYEETQNAYKKDKTFNSGEGVFKVLGNGELTYLKPLHPENTWFVVPNMVKKNGFLYKVVKVSTKAFMGCEKATKIKIGKNVQSMGEYVFKNTPAMGKLIMLTSKLATGKVKNTFVSGGKDKGAKLTNYVPSGKSSAYDSLFKGEGGMNAKAKFTEEN